MLDLNCQDSVRARRCCVHQRRSHSSILETGIEKLDGLGVVGYRVLSQTLDVKALPWVLTNLKIGSGGRAEKCRGFLPLSPGKRKEVLDLFKVDLEKGDAD